MRMPPPTHPIYHSIMGKKCSMRPERGRWELGARLEDPRAIGECGRQATSGENPPYVPH